MILATTPSVSATGIATGCKNELLSVMIRLGNSMRSSSGKNKYSHSAIRIRRSVLCAHT